MAPPKAKGFHDPKAKAMRIQLLNVILDALRQNAEKRYGSAEDTWSPDAREDIALVEEFIELEVGLSYGKVIEA